MVMIPSNGNGHLVDPLEADKFLRTPDSMDKAFKGQSSEDALTLLGIVKDGHISESRMILDLPSNRMALAAAMLVSACKEHGFKGGIDFVEDTLAFLPAVHGKRANLVGDTIIGERRWKQGERDGNSKFKQFQNWILNK